VVSNLALSIQIGRKSSLYNSENKDVTHTHQLGGESQNAVCLNGVGHDDDSSNANSSDAFHVGGPNGGDEDAR
jgi:hypothetical protein